MLGFIYEIKSKDKSLTETYIGSCWDMKQRKKSHTENVKYKTKKYNYPLYIYIRENGGFDNFEMIVIDSGECEDVRELHCAEQFYIDMSGDIENLLNNQDALMNKQQRIEKQNIAVKKSHQKAKDEKRFYCKICDIALTCPYNLNTHLNSISCKKKRNNLGNP